MDDDISRDFVVAGLHSLEEQLLDFMAYVPYIESNRAVVSPRFAPILIDACSLIDSVFRDAAGGTAHHTLKTYSNHLEPRLDLEPSTTIGLMSPIQLFRPFQGWSTSVPSWWAAYNRVKHDRLRNFPAASYVITVTAVAALHQVLARSWQFLGNLTRAGWFNETSEGFVEMLAARAAGSGPPYLPVQTKLFVSAIRSDFVVWDRDPPRIEPWDFTDRVKSQIWE